MNFSVSSVNCHYSLTAGHHRVHTLNSGVLLRESQISPYSLKEPVHCLPSSPSFQEMSVEGGGERPLTWVALAPSPYLGQASVACELGVGCV